MEPFLLGLYEKVVLILILILFIPVLSALESALEFRLSRGAAIEKQEQSLQLVCNSIAVLARRVKVFVQHLSSARAALVSQIPHLFELGARAKEEGKYQQKRRHKRIPCSIPPHSPARCHTTPAREQPPPPVTAPPERRSTCLAPAELQRSLSLGSCLYCGETGHYVASCPSWFSLTCNPKSTDRLDHGDTYGVERVLSYALSVSALLPASQVMTFPSLAVDLSGIPSVAALLLTLPPFQTLP